jgi:hypothetical protein
MKFGTLDTVLKEIAAEEQKFGHDMNFAIYLMKED